MARARCVIDLGPATTLGSLSQTTSDLAAVSDVALRWARIEAERQARQTIDRLATSGEPGAFLERSSGLEGGAYDQILLFSEWTQAHRRWADDPIGWETYSHQMERIYRRFGRGKVPPLPLLGGAPMSLEQFAPDIYRRLVVAEVAQRSPGPIRIESARYENPWELILAGVGLLVGGGGVLGTLPMLLQIGRDWSADRRVAAARARKAEAEAELYELAVQRLQGGTTPDEVVGLMSGEDLDALQRLGQMGVQWEELSESDEVPQPS